MSYIENIDVNLSDPHENDQTVFIITLTKGKKVVYKPKSMATEHAFFNFVDLLNENSNLQLRLLCPAVIDKKTYGWSSYFNHKLCEDKNQLLDFYKRIGMFSALFYILRGTDYHHDNLIAHKAHPIFIDHEMIFLPISIVSKNNDIFNNSISTLQKTYYESVINTRLFPIDEVHHDKLQSDISGIGFFNTTTNNSHLPFLDISTLDVIPYAKAITSGFKDVYSFFNENKATILNDAKWLSLFKKSIIRFNFRRTSAYLRINILCLSPNTLKSGQDFCNFINSLQDRLPSIFPHYSSYALKAEELKMLTRLDVPRFTTKPNSKRLVGITNPKLNDIFNFTGYQLVSQRIMDLSEKDLKQQIGYIEDSLYQKS